MGSDFDDDFSRIFARNNMELRDEIMKYVEERFISKKKIEEVDYKKANNWKSRNINGEWFDKCPDCLEEGE